MKTEKLALTMRRAAGIVYGLLFLAEIYLMLPLYETYSMVYAPVTFSLLFAAAVGAACVWLLAGKAQVAVVAGRRVAVATGLYVGLRLLGYALFDELLAGSLETKFGTVIDNMMVGAPSDIARYAIVVVQLVALVVAAFCVLNSRVETQAAPHDEGEGTAEPETAACEESPAAVDELRGETERPEEAL